MANNPMQMIIQMLSSGGNPQQMIQNMMQQNPQINAVLNQARNSGMTMEQYVRQYAKQNNINIDQMVDTLRRNGVKF